MISTWPKIVLASKRLRNTVLGRLRFGVKQYKGQFCALQMQFLTSLSIFVLFFKILLRFSPNNLGKNTHLSKCGIFFECSFERSE